MRQGSSTRTKEAFLQVLVRKTSTRHDPRQSGGDGYGRMGGSILEDENLTGNGEVRVVLAFFSIKTNYFEVDIYSIVIHTEVHPGEWSIDDASL